MLIYYGRETDSGERVFYLQRFSWFNLDISDKGVRDKDALGRGGRRLR